MKWGGVGQRGGLNSPEESRLAHHKGLASVQAVKLIHKIILLVASGPGKEGVQEDQGILLGFDIRLVYPLHHLRVGVGGLEHLVDHSEAVVPDLAGGIWPSPDKLNEDRASWARDVHG